MNIKKCKIAVLGLGYVGLPLLLQFSKKFRVIGFDTDQNKIYEIKKIIKNKFIVSSDQNLLKDCNIFIVTVPTPIYANKIPNLNALKKATQIISNVLKKGDLVIFESTVYPGLTEEICIPILRNKNKFKLNRDIFVGYSPERISPGEKDDFTNINKVISGSNLKTTNFILRLYKKIIKANIFKASSIKVAEASKIVENVQRDINISFMNEISLIFSRLNINTQDVLKAAKTKWNFLNFFPGLVGGHCISVDPYYLAYKAKQKKYDPQVILSGRKINNSMGFYVGGIVIKKIKKKFRKKKINLGVFGLTFKENTNDTRDSKVFDMIKMFNKKNIKVYAIDPNLTKKDIPKNLNIKLNKKIKKLDVLVLAVPHREFLKFNYFKMKKILNKEGAIFDIRGVLKDKKIKSNFDYWSL